MATLVETTTWVFDEMEGDTPCWGVLWHGHRYGGRFYQRCYAEGLAERLEQSSADDHQAWRAMHGLAVAA